MIYVNNRERKTFEFEININSLKLIVINGFTCSKKSIYGTVMGMYRESRTQMLMYQRLGLIQGLPYNSCPRDYIYFSKSVIIYS